MRKSAPFQIAGKLRYTPTDNGFKQVQIAYLAVISNLDELVQPCYMLLMQIRPLARPRSCHRYYRLVTGIGNISRDAHIFHS